MRINKVIRTARKGRLKRVRGGEGRESEGSE